MLAILRSLPSYLALFLGLLLFVKSPSGAMGGLIWLPKLWAGAWAPCWVLLGGFGAVVAALSNDYAAALAGLLGVALALCYTRRVTRASGAFPHAFGASWQDRIPSYLRARLPPRRYAVIQASPRAVPGWRNVNLGLSDGTPEPLLCDIWQPPPGISHTGLAVIYFHGGLWQACDKDFLTQPLFRRLANQGHVIMDVAYSLAPGADLDRMLSDVKMSILWMKSHAGEYAIDPKRIVLMGVSGGAHLALMAAYAPDHPAFQTGSAAGDISVRAVVSLFGVTDLCAFFREYGRSNPKQPEYSGQITDDLRPRVHDGTWLDRYLTHSRSFPAYRYGNMPGGALLLVELLGGTLCERPEAYQKASPLMYVGPHCPPTLQVSAGDDFIIDVAHGRRLHEALRQCGVTSVYLEFPNAVHGFDQYFGVSRRVAPAAQAATYDIERFLALMI